MARDPARGGRLPATLDAFLAECHAAGQTRPTPLLLRYGPDDFNCLHQDLYGPLVFPLQLTVLLSAPGVDFSGGEFVLVEQRPRAQSRPQVVPLSQGEAVIFPVHHRPVQGARGPHRVTMRHGVSRVTGGVRQTLGIIFHDAAVNDFCHCEERSDAAISVVVDNATEIASLARNDRNSATGRVPFLRGLTDPFARRHW